VEKRENVIAKDPLFFYYFFSALGLVQVSGHEHQFLCQTQVTDSFVEWAVAEIAPETECKPNVKISFTNGNIKFEGSMKVCLNFAATQRPSPDFF